LVEDVAAIPETLFGPAPTFGLGWTFHKQPAADALICPVATRAPATTIGTTTDTRRRRAGEWCMGLLLLEQANRPGDSVSPR